jgi:hypothetical protein
MAGLLRHASHGDRQTEELAAHQVRTLWRLTCGMTRHADCVK